MMSLEAIKKEFPIGSKVIPHSKSSGSPLEDCRIYRKLQESDVNYLYVIGYDVVDRFPSLILNFDRKATGGNFYLPSDVTIIEKKKTVYLFD